MLALCQEHRLEHRTKHIALRYFLARELQQRGQLRLAYVASQANTADIFTKALPPGDHQRFCTMLACFALLDWSCDLLFSPTLLMGAPRLWKQYMHARLIRIGFRQLPHDPGMYRLTKGADYILLIVYVNDLLYIGSTDDITTWFEGELQRDLTLTVSSTVTQ
ncbi:unnamed protein product [Closterium sp. NIES-53]